MNHDRIVLAAANIKSRRLALTWLEEYGLQLTGNGEAAVVHVSLYFARSCPGHEEAAQVIAAYATLNLPKAVRDAIECCRNEIAMATDAIRKEIET